MEEKYEMRKAYEGGSTSLQFHSPLKSECCRTWVGFFWRITSSMRPVQQSENDAVFLMQMLQGQMAIRVYV